LNSSLKQKTMNHKTEITSITFLPLYCSLFWKYI